MYQNPARARCAIRGRSGRGHGHVCRARPRQGAESRRGRTAACEVHPTSVTKRSVPCRESPRPARGVKGYGPYGAKHWASRPTPGLCSDCLRSLTGSLPHSEAVGPRRPEVNRSKDPASGGIPSVKLLQAAPTDWRQPAARSSGSAFQTKCLVSTIHMRWRLASSAMLHVNPKVRGQHPRRLERRAGSPPLSST